MAPMYSVMHLTVIAVPVTLCMSQAPWASIFLTYWLWRYRRVKVLVYRRARTKRVDPTSTISSHPRAKPEWVRRKVLYLASHLRSCRDVTHAFNRWQGCWATVGKSWVAEFIHHHAEEISQLRRERRRKKPYFIPVGHTWALDLTFLQSPYGATFAILGIIDAGSRKLLYLKVLPTKCAFALIGHLFLAFSRHGLPFAIRTDNEAMFTSAMWGMTLKALAIIHRRGPPHQPWHNGRIERLFGTLKAPLRRLGLATATSLQAALDQFRDFYNKVRPHQSLGGLTPEEAWRRTTMAEVQQAHAQAPAEGEWAERLGGQLVGYRLRR